MKPLLPTHLLIRRLIESTTLGLSLVAISLLIGMAGYHRLEGLAWIDAFLNASMLLSGMGPLFSPVTRAGKLFAGFYALYSGLTVLIIAGIMFAPLIHRFLHRLHLDSEDEERSTT